MIADPKLPEYHDLMKQKRVTARHPSARAPEPVQVYLAEPDLERLDRLAAQLGLSKSEVLRRGLAALDAPGSEPEQGAPRIPVPVSTRRGGPRKGIDLDRMSEVWDLLDAGDDPS